MLGFLTPKLSTFTIAKYTIIFISQVYEHTNLLLARLWILDIGTQSKSRSWC